MAKKVVPFPTKREFCSWCWKKVRVPHNFNEEEHIPFCTRGCKDAHNLFKALYPD